MKVKCKDCKKLKPTDKFSRHQTSATGYANSCKDCISEKRKSRPLSVKYFERKQQERETEVRQMQEHMEDLKQRYRGHSETLQPVIDTIADPVCEPIALMMGLMSDSATLSDERARDEEFTTNTNKTSLCGCQAC